MSAPFLVKLLSCVGIDVGEGGVYFLLAKRSEAVTLRHDVAEELVVRFLVGLVGRSVGVSGVEHLLRLLHFWHIRSVLSFPTALIRIIADE